jgi:3-hydroxyisobutyrate dehydrogenase-like beta-hydroxyacid dehydrogenase
MTTVGFIGLGAMGSRMARRLLLANHELVVWNRSSSKMDPLLELGAVAGDSPAALANASDVVVTMISDPAALRAIMEGSSGVLAGVGPASTLIEMSTVGPDAIDRLNSMLPGGTGLLDAPVLGSMHEAESGSLKIFVGGPAPLAERWMPLLSKLGTPIHVGPVGSGAAAKLVANLTLLGTLGILGEALALAQGLGLDRTTAFEVLAVTPLAAQAERRRSSIEEGAFPARFSLALATKDADLIAEAATESKVDARLLEAARRWLHEAEDASWGDRDYAALLAWIVERGGASPT